MAERDELKVLQRRSLCSRTRRPLRSPAASLAAPPTRRGRGGIELVRGASLASGTDRRERGIQLFRDQIWFAKLLRPCTGPASLTTYSRFQVEKEVRSSCNAVI